MLRKFREVVIFDEDTNRNTDHFGHDGEDSVVYIEFQENGIELSRAGEIKLNFIPYNNILNINYVDKRAKVFCKSYWRR